MCLSLQGLKLNFQVSLLLCNKKGEHFTSPVSWAVCNWTHHKASGS